MSFSAVIILSLAVFIATVIQGTSGIGFALVVAPVAALLAPELVPGIVLLLMLPLNAFVALREWRFIDWRGVTWISLGRIVFTAVGLILVAALSDTGLTILVAIVTIGAALVSLFAPEFHPSRTAFLAAGAITGVSETATGVGGPPLGLVYQHSYPSVLRSTVATCFFIGEVVSLIALIATGTATDAWRLDFLKLLPALILGLLISSVVVRRYPRLNLRIGVIVFSLISGVVLLFQALA